MAPRSSNCAASPCKKQDAAKTSSKRAIGRSKMYGIALSKSISENFINGMLFDLSKSFFQTRILVVCLYAKGGLLELRLRPKFADPKHLRNKAKRQKGRVSSYLFID